MPVKYHPPQALRGRSPAQLQPKPQVVLIVGRDLNDHREEAFVRMVCDGLSLGEAYQRAGFNGSSSMSPMAISQRASRLFRLPHVQERANAILEARKNSAAVTLPEVTDMLKRVYAGALHKGEYASAHNSAFSLARLYGLVVDRSQVEVIRRPSRDPDAPVEEALTGWINALPGPGPAPMIDVTPNAEALPAEALPAEALPAEALPAEALPEPEPGRALGPAPSARPRAPDASEPQGPGLFGSYLPQGPALGPYRAPSGTLIPSGPANRYLDTEGPGLSGIGLPPGPDDGTPVGPGRSENGAPVRPVTGTPRRRGKSSPEKELINDPFAEPRKKPGRPRKMGEKPSEKELISPIKNPVGRPKKPKVLRGPRKKPMPPAEDLF